MTNNIAFTYTLYIETSVEKLWDALTNPDLTEKYWYGVRMVSDWKVGSKIEGWWPNGKLGDSGKVIESLPYKKLSFMWHVEGIEDMKTEPDSRATYEFATLNNVVKFVLTHDQFQAESLTYKGIQDGWPKILSSLKSFLETDSPLPITTKEAFFEEVKNNEKLTS